MSEKKKPSLKTRLKKSFKPQNKPEAEKPESEEGIDPQNEAARNVARYAEIKEEIRILEKEAKDLQTQFDPIVKPLAQEDDKGSLEWLYKGVRARYIKVETQSAEPDAFYELTGDNGLRFLTVSVSKAQKAIETGELTITKEQLREISEISSYMRFEAKIVSATQAAELFE